jgi:hypothetical protein
MSAITAREQRQADANEDQPSTGLLGLHERIAKRVKGR